jgi:kynureninase
LTPDFLRKVSLHQVTLLADEFDAIGVSPDVISRDQGQREEFGGFLALRASHAQRFQSALADQGVHTDSRGEYLRLGPAPYVSDEQIRTAMRILRDVVT